MVGVGVLGEKSFGISLSCENVMEIEWSNRLARVYQSSVDNQFFQSFTVTISVNSSTKKI